MAPTPDPRRPLRQATPLVAKPAPPVRKPAPAEPQAAPQPAVPGVVIQTDDPLPLAHRRKKRSPLVPVLIGAGVLLAGCAVAAFLLLSSSSAPEEGRPPFALAPLGEQTIDELSPLSLQVEVRSGGSEPLAVTYRLVDAPEGATIDEATGAIAWTPTEEQGPGNFTLSVEATSAEPAFTARQKIRVAVKEVNQPPVVAEVPEQKVQPGGTVDFVIEASDPDSPAQPIVFRLTKGREHGAQMDGRTGRFLWKPATLAPGVAYPFEVEAIENVRGGLMTKVAFQVVAATGARPQPEEVAVDTPPERPAPLPQPAEDPAPASIPVENFDKPPAYLQTILDLHEGKKLFDVAQYPALRKAFADEFAAAHAEEIQQGLGVDYDMMSAWLDEHAAIKEELFLAMHERDNVPAALKLFTEIKKTYPEKIVPYANLAIALAVTWDTPGNVYSYEGHQNRAKALPSTPQALALENFKYLLDAEPVMQGRGQFMPWEFLVYVVDHKTPVAERQWALQNYLQRRTMFGRCYSEVPYDNEMLRTQSEKARLNGMVYSLPNIRTFGGVCAMQADFSSRVGKSLGVPSAYVGGEAASGDSHAWVMWVEIKQVTASSIVFTLESAGRYRIDNYYVGNLRDPQTGLRITDRELELRLHTVGINPLAKRHAALVMKAYPLVKEKAKLDFAARQDYLAAVTRLCPGNEDAWHALAAMSSEGQIKKEDHKRMYRILDQFFATFALFPDFTWKVFDDFVAFQDDPLQRTKLFERLVLMYESARRPDLACEARLKLTDYLLKDQKTDAAIQGLALTIKKFPDEGRYVPRMLDKLEEICRGAKGAETALAQFYLEFLPLIPPKRGSDPSKYCMEMYQRGIDRMTEAQQPQAAALIKAQLDKLQGK